MWDEMEAAASESDSSLWDVSTTMTLFAMNRLDLTTRGAFVHRTGGQQPL